MKINNLKAFENKGDFRLSVLVDSEKLGKKELWFSTKKEYAKGVCKDKYDAFLVGMLYPAMQYGEDIHIEGVVSSKLLFNINNYVISLIKAFSPSCKNIKVTADKVSTKNYQGEGVGTGFSGGVDSFCTIYDHYEIEEDPNYKINSFCF